GPSFLHRFLCGAVIVVAVCGLCADRRFEDIVLALPLFGWAAAFLWMSDDEDRLAPLAWACGIGALVVAGFPDHTAWSYAQDPSPVRWIANVASAALLPVLAVRLAGSARVLQSRVVQLLVAGAVVFAALWLPAPGVAIGLAFVLAGIATDRIAVTAL